MATQAVPLSAIRRKTGPASKKNLGPAKKASPWILDRWRDLLLFVGTPVLLIPVFSAAQSRWSGQDIFLFVGAFGAMGHHLPGMIRAYGDRALFERFKVRFIVAPIALLAVCVWASVYDIQAIQLVAMGWGIWHGMMQTYGFCRIYDAKASAGAAARARMDFFLCFAWFIGAVILSRERFGSWLNLYHASGGPVIQAASIEALRSVVVVGLGLVTLGFLLSQLRDWRSERAASPVKLVLLGSSIAFWWYCNNGVQNLLVGISLFEVFHDVQYLSIVWIYNRARVERDNTIHGFMRFVFRRSGALIGVYVGLVLAYGAIGFTTSSITIESIRHVLLGIVTASALLHFYYDGFIWKVREKETRSMLGIDGAGASLVSPRRLPGWAVHGLRWALLIVPFGVLAATQLFEKSQLSEAKALHNAGRIEEAITRYEAAVSRNPSLAEAEFYLGLAWKDLGDLDRAVQHYERALAIDPKNAKSESNLAGILVTRGKLDEAQERYEHCLSVDPRLQIAHKELADILVGKGEYESGISHYEEALRIQPDFKQAKQNLDFARTLVGR